MNIRSRTTEPHFENIYPKTWNEVKFCDIHDITNITAYTGFF